MVALGRIPSTSRMGRQDSAPCTDGGRPPTDGHVRLCPWNGSGLRLPTNGLPRRAVYLARLGVEVECSATVLPSYSARYFEPLVSL